MDWWCKVQPESRSCKHKYNTTWVSNNINMRFRCTRIVLLRQFDDRETLKIIAVETFSFASVLNFLWVHEMLWVVHSFVDISQVTEVEIKCPWIASNASSRLYVGLDNGFQSGGVTVIMHQMHKELPKTHSGSTGLACWFPGLRLSTRVSSTAGPPSITQVLRGADFSDHIGPIGHRFLVDFQLLLIYNVRSVVTWRPHLKIRSYVVSVSWPP